MAKVKKTQTTMVQALELAEWLVDAFEQSTKYSGVFVSDNRSDYTFLRKAVADMDWKTSPSKLAFIVAVCLKPRTKTTRGGWIHLMVGGTGPIFDLFKHDVVKALGWQRESEILLKEALLDYQLKFPYHGNIHAHVAPLEHGVELTIKELIQQVQFDHDKLNRGLYQVNFEVLGLVKTSATKPKFEWKSGITHSWVKDAQKIFW